MSVTKPLTDMYQHVTYRLGALLLALAFIAAPAQAQQRSARSADQALTAAPSRTVDFTANPAVHKVQVPSLDAASLRAASLGARGGVDCDGSEVVGQDSLNAIFGFFEGGGSTELGQSFTAPCSGTVEGIAFDVFNLFVPGDADFTVYTGAGNTGAVLFSQPITIASTGPQAVVFDPGLPVLDGSVYTFVLSIPPSNGGTSVDADISAFFDFNGDTGDLYPGGDAYAGNDNTGGTSMFAPVPGADLVFGVSFGSDVPPPVAGCGTDSFGYTCTDSDDANNPPAFDFKDISDSGTALGLGDDDGVFVDIGFDFPFYGVTYTSIGISSNGYLTFDTSDLTPSDLSNDPIPSPGTPNALIAALWDDLDPACAAPDPCEIYVQNLGDKLVIQYDSVAHFPDSAMEYNTFQIALTPDGDIRITYLMFTDDASNSNSYTVGIENQDGTVGIQAAFNGTPPDYLRDNFAVCFDYPGSDAGCDKVPPPTCPLAFAGDPTLTPNPAQQGQRVSLAGQVTNSGDAKAAKLVVNYSRDGGPMGTLMYGPANVPSGGPFGFKVRQRIPGGLPSGTYNLDIQLVNDNSGEVCDFFFTTLEIGGARIAGESAEFVVDDPTLYIEAQDLAEPVQATAAPGEVYAAPNPFVGRTALTFATEQADVVRLAVYDVLGREIAVLVDGQIEAGVHRATFDAQGLAAGVYIYRLTVGSSVQSGRMMVAR